MIILSRGSSSVFAAGSSYQNCSREIIRCGSEDRNIGYPFWGMNRPDYCGYPGFHLNCTDDSQLELTIMSQTYRVVTTADDSQTVTVARADYTENLCPALLSNNTLNTTIFREIPAETANITLYYDCSPFTLNSNSYFNRFTCSINGSNNLLNYYTTLNPGNLGPFLAAVSRCQDTVVLQAGRMQVQNLGNSISFNTDNLMRTLGSGFPLRWSADNSLCEDCRDSGGECRRNVSSGGFRCFCRDGDGVNVNNTTTCPSGDNESGSRVRKEVFLGVSGGVLGVVITVIIMIMRNNLSVTTCIRSQEKVMNNHNVEALIVNHGSLAPKRYNYSDIKKMTRSFQCRVGKGGYAIVYRGNLLNGRVVAVKLLSETKGNGEEFINEVASIARTSHVNIVSLVGFCYQGKKRALVYEFMPNGSLDRFISAKGVTSNRLGWGTMYEISIGIARGLEYLHRGCNTRILHFDIKPQNILLDKEFCPKISDFGLAKLCKRGESIISMTGARGTIGYIAPEVFYRGYGGVSHKSDVYSYGMLVLEMVGGRSKTDETAPSDASEAHFPDWIYKDLERGNIGVPHEDITEEEEEKVRKMILVSLWCIQIIPSDRPSMSKVVEMLEGSVHSLQVPPKPLLFSPTMQALDSSTVQELSQYQTA